MGEYIDPKKNMHLALIHNDYKPENKGFRAIESLCKTINGFLTGIDHTSDHQNGPCINMAFYNTLSDGELRLTSLMNNISRSGEFVEVQKDVSEKFINEIDDLLDQSLNKNEFKLSLTKLFKDYDIKEKSIIKKESKSNKKELPF